MKPTFSDIMNKARAAYPDDSAERQTAIDAEVAAREAKRQANLPDCFKGELPEHISEVPNFIDKLREMLEYDPETGLLYYAFMPRTELRLEEKATQPYGPNRYTRVKIWGLSASAANVVWLLHHERWPHGRLLRKDGDATNDRIENLVEAVSRGSGDAPRGRRPSRGVARSGPHHWQAYTHIDGVQKNLGRFKTEAEALARRAAWDRGEDLV